MPYTRLKLKFRDKFIRSTHKTTVYYHVIDEDRSKVTINSHGTAIYQLYVLCGKRVPTRFRFFFQPPEATQPCKGCHLTPAQREANKMWRMDQSESHRAGKQGPPPF